MTRVQYYSFHMIFLFSMPVLDESARLNHGKVSSVIE